MLKSLILWYQVRSLEAADTFVSKHLHCARGIQGVLPCKGWGGRVGNGPNSIYRLWYHCYSVRLWSIATSSCPLGYFSSITASSWQLTTQREKVVFPLGASLQLQDESSLLALHQAGPCERTLTFIMTWHIIVWAPGSTPSGPMWAHINIHHDLTYYSLSCWLYTKRAHVSVH